MKTTVRSGRAMGSPLRITLPGSQDAAADLAWRIVRRTFADAEAVLTRFDTASPLSRLNRACGLSEPVPRLLARALAAAWRAFRITAGRFDPRIIGALEEAGEHAGVALPPSPRRLRPSDRWLGLDPRAGHARLAAPVDLGGIGKGLALRWSARALRRRGVGEFLLQAGGDIMSGGRGPAGRPWVVGLEDPANPGRVLCVIQLDEPALATSSVAVRHWTGEDGEERHHLIDPATLRPAEVPLSLVAVAGPDPAWAEVASKAAFLAGRSIGSAIGPGRTWWLTREGQLHRSDGRSAANRG